MGTVPSSPPLVANPSVRHLVALDTSVDPGARDLEEARRFTRVPQSVPKLFCCVHARRLHLHPGSCNTNMSHCCIDTYLSSSKLTRYSRRSFTLRPLRSRSKASTMGAGSRYQERASSMRSLTTSLSDCRPVSFIRWSSHVRTSRGTRTMMLDNSIVRGVRAMETAYQTCVRHAR